MKKSLKKQAVFPVLMLLVVTALALIGSSFAWFSMSTTASVTTVSGQIEDSSVGLMISQDALHFTSSVTLDKTAATYVRPYRFHQMSSVNGQTFYDATITQKNADGTAAMITTAASTAIAKSGSTGTLVGWYTNNNTPTNLPSAYRWNGEYDTTPVSENDATAYRNQVGYMVFDLFFEVEAASKLYLNDDTTFSAGTNNNAMRVAFISYGGTAIGENDTAETVAATAIALDTPAAAQQNRPNPVIWNPTAASDAAADYYGISAANSTEFAPYTSGSNSTQVDAKSNAELWHDGVAFSDTDNMDAYTPLMDLVAGVNKLRVVVWLEGNDASCTTKVAKLNISFALNFFAKANA